MGVCFLCQKKLLGERTRVCSSVTPKCHVPFPEIIAEFLGEDFVVIVNTTDHLCKTCTDLILYYDKANYDLKSTKETMIGSIEKKYGPFPPEQPVAMVETENMKDMAQRNIPSGSQTPNIFKKPFIKSPSKIARNPEPSKKSQNSKIYKCGFCPFQSKVIESVRTHMRCHIKKNGEKRPTVTGPPPALPTTLSLKKKFFKCQVCSTSFENRNDCLHHIRKDHNRTTLSLNVNESNNVVKPAETSKSNGQQQVMMSPRNVNGQQEQVMMSPRNFNGQQEQVMMSPRKVYGGQQEQVMMSPGKVNDQQEQVIPRKGNGQQQQVMSTIHSEHLQVNNGQQQQVMSTIHSEHFQVNNGSTMIVNNGQQQQQQQQINSILEKSMMFNHSIPVEEARTGGEQAQAMPDMFGQGGSIQFVDEQGMPVNINIKTEVDMADNVNNVEHLDLEAMLADLNNETSNGMGFAQNLM